MASWSYDDRINRYRDGTTGRLLKKDTVVGYRDAIVDKAATRTAELANAVANGTITPSDFAAELRKITKEVYATQYSLGRGGVNALDRSDIGKLGSALRSQYEYIDRFQRDIEAEKITDATSIANRAELYVESGVSAYEQGNASARGMELPPTSPPVHNRCRCSWRWAIEDGKHVAYWKLGDRPCVICGDLAEQYQPWRGREAA